MKSVFLEMRHRNVFRVAGSYAVIGWVTMQVVTVMTPALNLPDWIDSFIALLLIAGFPIALFLSWAFELTPEGIKRTEDVVGGDSTRPQKIRKLDIAILTALALVAMLIVGTSLPRITQTKNASIPAIDDMAQQTASTAPDQSIAVLPFVDMSAAGDQEYFGDGIAEEILHLLVKSPELKVAGRTSSFQYKDKNEDLRQIGESLNVRHILEGSVRKAGDELRITAQLIRSDDGFHVWSETYDGSVTDIFAVQENIALAIANSLETSLGIGAGSQAKARTDNIEAYEYYLRGLGYYASRGQNSNNIRFGTNSVSNAITSFEKAAALDPEFAAAWAGLSSTYVVAPGWLKTHNGQKVSRVVYNRKALFAANRAIELNPDLAISQHALANIMMQYWQWERAEDALLKALSLEPNSQVILEDYREFLSKVGRLDEAVTIARRMLDMEPQNVEYLELMLISEMLAGNYALVLKAATQYAELVEPKSDEDIAFELEYRAGIFHVMGKMDEANSLVTNCSKCSPEVKAYVLSLLEQVENPSADFQIEALKFRPWRYFSLAIGGADAHFDKLEDDFATGGIKSFYALGYNFGNISANPRFKPMIVDAGLVRYWRARGWPKRCRPVGEDDFECGAVKEDSR